MENKLKHQYPGMYQRERFNKILEDWDKLNHDQILSLY